MAIARPVYLDYNAAAPLDGHVLEAMRPFLEQRFGNPASQMHRFGQEAEHAVSRARRQVATLLGADDAREIVWTSGATESNNLVLKGLAEVRRGRGGHIITQGTEHRAVLDPCAYLESQGFAVTRLPVDRVGRISLSDLEAAFRPDTFLVSIMWANNETGTIQPIREIGAICRDRRVLFHTDAAQAPGRVPVNVIADNVDLLSLSSHKMYGPKGCGALYLRRHGPPIAMVPLLHGGGHEWGLRSGTLNVPGIVGFGAACEIAAAELGPEAVWLGSLRDRLEQGLRDRLSLVHVNGDMAHRLPQTSNLTFEHADGEGMLAALYAEVAISTGSACTSASRQPSHVLRAMGVPDELSHSSLRFSLGRFTTEEEVDYVIGRVVKAVTRLRELNPAFHPPKQ